MSHKIEISDKTFEDLREFCKLNDLKIGQYADKLIREGLMIEMYGDVPFTNYRKPKREEIVELVRETEMESSPINEESSGKTRAAQAVKDVIEQFKNTAEIFQTVQMVKPIDEGTKAQMIETMEKVEAEHPQTYITNQEGEKEIQKEMLKQLGTISASDIEDYVGETKKMQEAALEQAGVPAKVINKITKRRLK